MLVKLARRPEVAQLKQQAASTVSSAAKTGQQQLIQTAQRAKEVAAEKRSAKKMVAPLLQSATGQSGGVVPFGSRRSLFDRLERLLLSRRLPNPQRTRPPWNQSRYMGLHLLTVPKYSGIEVSQS
jgi:hypothetical protein